ncbi:hypothetical protein E2C01_011604 [Portunus trituberculatus]|uniref:Uncharacterized protein n=1 Tax=Portunus trituberculatus TaxID=210409 RepID=A0A5B7DBT6_PORTR|nr:hypothetical protein [Portunus trituberculatus]
MKQPQSPRLAVTVAITRSAAYTFRLLLGRSQHRLATRPAPSFTHCLYITTKRSIFPRICE